MPEVTIAPAATPVVEIAKGSLHSSVGDSLLVTVVGMAVVFMGLVILICLIKVLAKATENMGKKKKSKEAPKPAAAPAPVTPEPVVEEAVDDGAVIAAISAAIACMLDEGSAFTVRHIRRIPAKK